MIFDLISHAKMVGSTQLLCNMQTRQTLLGRDWRARLTHTHTQIVTHGVECTHRNDLDSAQIWRQNLICRHSNTHFLQVAPPLHLPTRCWWSHSADKTTVWGLGRTCPL